MGFKEALCYTTQRSISMAGNDDRAFGVDELQMNVKQSKSLVGTEKRVSIHVTGPGYDKAGSDDGE